jgi:hypothetical protein
MDKLHSLTTKQHRMLTDIVRYPDDITNLNWVGSDEARDWLSESNDNLLRELFTEALLMTDTETRRLNKVLLALLGDATLDDISELRDILRSLLIDRAKHQMQLSADLLVQGAA